MKLKNIIKDTLNEYVTNEIVYLKDYFKMPKSSKTEYLPHEYYYFFEDFLDETTWDFQRPDYVDDDNVYVPFLIYAVSTSTVYLA
jgi:hypothetical protein